jgi:hypothetical protein
LMRERQARRRVHAAAPPSLISIAHISSNVVQFSEYVPFGWNRNMLSFFLSGRIFYGEPVSTSPEKCSSHSRAGVEVKAQVMDKTTPRRPRWAAALALVAIVFGVITVFVGGKTLFGGAEERANAGNIVLFVLWFNFVAGIAYGIAGLGLFLWKRWAARLSAAIAAATIAVFVAFGAHILLGGAFEARTVGAMLIRSAVWIVIAASACRALGCFQRGASRPA